MSKKNIDSGKIGEKSALMFLRKAGYKIILCNYKTKLGEIDIIAFDRDTLVFIEVKSRSTNKYGFAYEAVNLRKQAKIQAVALSFLKEKKFFHKKARFDVVSITGNNQPDLIKNAFELNQQYTY